MANRELRFLGRYRSRGYADFRDFVPVPPELANKYQPGRRSNDDLRGYLCCNLSWYSRRTSLVGLLVDSVSKSQPLDVAPVPITALVGRVRGRYLRFDNRLFSGTWVWYRTLQPIAIAARHRFAVSSMAS